MCFSSGIRSECGMRTSFSFLYKRMHVARSSLHACACCTVIAIFATRVRMLHVFATRVCMLHCRHFTREHVVLNQAKSPSRFSALAISQKLRNARIIMPKNALGVQTYFVFSLRGYFPLYTQFLGQQFECFDEHVLSLSF